ncbi:glutathione synthase, partial [Candidatus Margulisiibacteriota bacterium]
IKDNLVQLKTKKVIPQRKAQNPFKIESETILTENNADIIFIRPDPPFDQQYLINTWLLDRIKHKVLVINDPAGIRAVNEKLWISQFTDIIPKTLITADKNDFLDFLNNEKEIIIKPVNEFGGTGIFKLDTKSPNSKVAFEALSENSKKHVICQKYIPEAKVGDKRIVLLDGEPITSFLRVNTGIDHRNNVYAGGRPEAAGITKRDKELINRIKPFLKKLGLHWVGIDIIGDYLIEVNVTSPSGIREAHQVYGIHLEDKIISFAEKMESILRS